MEERDPLLSEAYRDAGHPAPPPALDAAILDAARRAVAPAPRRRWFAWAAPMATTAVLVLGVSLLFTLRREAPEVLREAPPSPAIPARVPDGAAVSAAPKEYATEKTASPPNVKSRVAGAPHSLSKPDGAPDAGPFAKQRALSAPIEAGTYSTAGPAPRSAPASLPPAAVSATALPASPAREALPEVEPAQSAVGRAGDNAARRDGAAPKAIFDSPSRQGIGGITSESASTPSLTQWLEHIRLLLRQGRGEEARASLAALRGRYPDFEVPEDLEVLVEPGSPGKVP